MNDKLRLCKCGALPESVAERSRSHAITTYQVNCLSCGHYIYRNRATSDKAQAIKTWNNGRDYEDARKSSNDKLVFDLEQSGDTVQKALARIIKAVESDE